MSQQLINLLREKSRQIAPDYPGIEGDLDPFEHLWAITSSYEGTSLANDDLHNFVKFLLCKLGMTPLEAYEEWKSKRIETLYEKYKGVTEQDLKILLE